MGDMKIHDRMLPLPRRLRNLINEIDCRIAHGADGTEHLKYVKNKLIELMEDYEIAMRL